MTGLENIPEIRELRSPYKASDYLSNNLTLLCNEFGVLFSSEFFQGFWAWMYHGEDGLSHIMKLQSEALSCDCDHGCNCGHSSLIEGTDWIAGTCIHKGYILAQKLYPKPWEVAKNPEHFDLKVPETQDLAAYWINDKPAISSIYRAKAIESFDDRYIREGYRIVSAETLMLGVRPLVEHDRIYMREIVGKTEVVVLFALSCGDALRAHTFDHVCQSVSYFSGVELLMPKGLQTLEIEALMQRHPASVGMSEVSVKTVDNDLEADLKCLREIRISPISIDDELLAAVRMADPDNKFELI